MHNFEVFLFVRTKISWNQDLKIALVPDRVLPRLNIFLFLFSQRFKRNLSISDQPEDSNNEILTSTPVSKNSGPRKKLITPSKITEFIPKYEENIDDDVPEEEDSFDRMCK